MKLETIKIKFEAYLLTEKLVSKNTFCAYKKDIQQFVAYLQKEGFAFEDLSDKIVQNFIHILNKKDLSARTIGRKISALKVFFDFCEREYNSMNYASNLLFPKIEKKLPQFLSTDEVLLLFKTVEIDTTFVGLRNKLILYILYVAGIRVSELTQLSISDVHFDTGFVLIEGKGGKQRMIPVPQQLMTMIKNYLQEKKLFFARKKIDDNTGYLFAIVYGEKIKPISRQSCFLMLKKICKQAGIKKEISPHQLRHSLATHMLQKGMDLRSLQLLLGHENIATVQIYTHLDTKHLRDVYDKKHPRSK